MQPCLPFIEAHVTAIRQREEAVLTTLIERAIAVKVRVVQEDPTERGVRAIQNFGHTLGHALEAATHVHAILAWRGGRRGYGTGGDSVGASRSL